MYGFMDAVRATARRLWWFSGLSVILCATVAVGENSYYIRKLPPVLEEKAPVEEIPPPSQDDTPSQRSFVVEPPPIQSSWYNPWRWPSPELWEGSFELGINGSAGNSETLSLRTGAKLSRETDKTKIKLDLKYAKTQAESVETQNNALLDNRIDWKMDDSPWTLFSRTGLEYDEFKNFDLRLSFNAGIGYRFIDSEATKLAGRFGAGASREFGGVDDDAVPEATFGLDFEKRISDRQKLIAAFDFYPSWEDMSDYRLVSDIAWEILLDEASNLHLKIGAIDRYDSTPNGARLNDLDYSLLLMWKL